jgi:hypothetical protein
VFFLENGRSPDLVGGKIDEGVRLFSGARQDTAAAGRAHSRRTMPV